MGNLVVRFFLVVVLGMAVGCGEDNIRKEQEEAPQGSFTCDSIVCDQLTECKLTAGVPSCSACPSGYEDINENGTICVDIDECTTGISGCEQNCVNTDGGFSCSCEDGYTLNTDGSSCDNTDDCIDNPCGNMGDEQAICFDHVNGYSCVCSSAFTFDGTSCSEPQFISTWQTDFTSFASSGENQISLPLEEDGIYDFIVDWGDGSSDSISSWDNPSTLHTYPSAGIYTVKIRGTIDGFGFGNNGEGRFSDASKLTDIRRWGQLRLSNSGGQFAKAKNLDGFSASDFPDLSHVTDMSYMFSSASSFNGDIGEWDLSHVTDMSYMFYGAVTFNSNISNWNTVNVRKMNWMFSGAESFNADISFKPSTGAWNTSNVVDMSSMFSGAYAFEPDIGNWDTSNVLDMSGMFSWTRNFNAEIGGWDTSRVSNMENMFRGSWEFDSQIGSWDTSSVVNMRGMFSGSAFNSYIGDWDTSNVTDMSSMFLEAYRFNSDIGDWDTGNVEHLYWMFWDADEFNQDLSSWCVSRFPNVPQGFPAGASFEVKHRPRWGTCPARE